MSVITPESNTDTLEKMALPEEFARHLEDAQGVAERFTNSFTPMVEQKLRQAMQAQLQEEFPKLAESPEIIESVYNKLSPESFEEKPFIFLSRNPEFVSQSEEN